jgi:hypothetical protein
MKDDINYEAPSDWGVSSKETWVSFEELKDNGAPTLEGRDVVGFLEFNDELVPEAIRKTAQVGTQYQNQKTKNILTKQASGRWKITGNIGGERPPTARRSQRLGGEFEKLKRQKEKEKAAVAKPEQQKPQESKKPEVEPKEKNKAPVPGSEADQEKEPTATNVDKYALDVVSEEDTKRVADLSARGSQDPMFESGQIAIKEIDKHYSGASPVQELFNKFPQDIRAISDAIKEGNLDAKIKMKGGKEVMTVRDIALQAGVKKQELQPLSNLIQLLDSQTESNGAWKTSATYSLSPGLDYASAKMIEQRSDLANSETTVQDIRTKAYSLGALSEDSKGWASLSPAAVDLAFELRTSKQRAQLNKSGTPDYFYDPTAPDGRGKANNIRGRMALFMWVKQGGKDCYATGGNIKPVGDFQVEHIKDMSSGGRDHKDNFALSVKYVNEARGSMSLPNLQNLGERKAKEVDKNLANPDGKFLQARLGALQKRGIHDALSATASPLKGKVSDLTSPAFFDLISSNQDKLPEDLKTSQEAFSSFVETINNNFEGSAKITSLSASKLEDLVSSMGELGASTDKVRDYLGRISFNNYHDGSRGTRGGTNESPGGLTSLENRALGKPDTVSEDRYEQHAQMIAASHAAIRDAREGLIKGKDGSNVEFHRVLSRSLHFISGKAEDSPEWLKSRASKPKDILNTVDTYLKNFPPESKVGNNLDGLYLSAAMSQYGFSAEEIANPNLLKQKAKRTQAEKLRDNLKLIRGN